MFKIGKSEQVRRK